MLLTLLACGTTAAPPVALAPVEVAPAAEPAWAPKNQCSKAEDQLLTCLSPEDPLVVTSVCWSGALSLRSGPGGQPDLVIEGDAWSRVALGEASVRVDGKELCGEVLEWDKNSLESHLPAVGHCASGERVRFSCVVQDGRTVSVCNDGLRIGELGSPAETAGPPLHKDITIARGAGESLTFVDDGLEVEVVETLGTGDANFFGFVAGDTVQACKGEDGEVHDRLGELK